MLMSQSRKLLSLAVRAGWEPPLRGPPKSVSQGLSCTLVRPAGLFVPSRSRHSREAFTQGRLRPPFFFGAARGGAPPLSPPPPPRDAAPPPLCSPPPPP